MNGVVKDKLRHLRDNKILELRKESLTDKVSMQRKFIEEIESRGKQDIKEKKEKKMDLQMRSYFIIIMKIETEVMVS